MITIETEGNDAYWARRLYVAITRATGDILFQMEQDAYDRARRAQLTEEYTDLRKIEEQIKTFCEFDMPQKARGSKVPEVGTKEP